MTSLMQCIIEKCLHNLLFSLTSRASLGVSRSLGVKCAGALRAVLTRVSLT